MRLYLDNRRKEGNVCGNVSLLLFACVDGAKYVRPQSIMCQNENFVEIPVERTQCLYRDAETIETCTRLDLLRTRRLDYRTANSAASDNFNLSTRIPDRNLSSNNNGHDPKWKEMA